MPEIISRKEAIERGLKRYFTGRPCKRGHILQRLVGNSACLQCEREASQRCRDAKRRPYPQMFCKICGTLFQPHHVAERYCSAQCRGEASRRYRTSYNSRLSPERIRERNERVLQWKQKPENSQKCLWWTLRWKLNNPDKYLDTKAKCEAKRAAAYHALKELGIEAERNTAYRALKELGIKIRIGDKE